MNDRTLAQTLALVFGVAFLGAGILGFIPGITTNYSDMTFAGNDSGAELLGLFQVSILHNIVHLLFGVGILMARTHEGALTYLLGTRRHLRRPRRIRPARRRHERRELRADQRRRRLAAPRPGGRPAGLVLRRPRPPRRLRARDLA